MPFFILHGMSDHVISSVIGYTGMAELVDAPDLGSGIHWM